MAQPRRARRRIPRVAAGPCARDVPRRPRPRRVPRCFRRCAKPSCPAASTARCSASTTPSSRPTRAACSQRTRRHRHAGHRPPTTARPPGWDGAAAPWSSTLREAIAEIQATPPCGPRPSPPCTRPTGTSRALTCPGTPCCWAPPSRPDRLPRRVLRAGRVLQLGLDRTEVSPGFSLEWYVDGLDLGTRDTALARADRLTVWAVVGDDAQHRVHPSSGHPAPRRSTLWLRGVPDGPLRGVAADLLPDTLVHTADGPVSSVSAPTLMARPVRARPWSAGAAAPLLDAGDRLVAAPASTIGRRRGGEPGAALVGPAPVPHLPALRPPRRLGAVHPDPPRRYGLVYRPCGQPPARAARRPGGSPRPGRGVPHVHDVVRLLSQGDVLTLVSAAQGHERAMPFTLEPWRGTPSFCSSWRPVLPTATHRATSTTLSPWSPTSAFESAGIRGLDLLTQFKRWTSHPTCIEEIIFSTSRHPTSCWAPCWASERAPAAPGTHRGPGHGLARALSSHRSRTQQRSHRPVRRRHLEPYVAPAS